MMNNNKESPSKPCIIDNLTNDLLREIFCRLPSYADAVRCKTVSKRLYFIISNPSFLTHAFSIHGNISTTQQSWALLLNLEMKDYNVVTVMFAAQQPRQKLSSSSSPRILSLQFLPYPATLVATFKDLALCFGLDPFTGSGVYYVCNPVTKQWINLPSYEHLDLKPLFPRFSRDPRRHIWATLICRDGINDFRVVAVPSFLYTYEHKDNSLTISSIVYLSEAKQWKKVDIKIRKLPDDGYYHERGGFSRIVCKERVYLTVLGYFGAFNPYDVTHSSCDTTTTSLTAISLPLPKAEVSLFEKNGKLMAFDDRLFISFDPYACLLQGWHCRELEYDEQHGRHVGWKQVSDIQGKVKVNGSMLSYNDGNYYYRVKGVHPYKDHLAYFIDTNGKSNKMQLIIFDTESKTLEFSTILPLHQSILASNRLDLPNWPTPIHP